MNILNSLAFVLDPVNLGLLALSVAGGIIVGALPGLTATMGVALLVPLTFSMNPSIGLIALIGVYIGAIYGGCISAVLLKTPGTPSSAATTLDGYPMAQKGQAGLALGTATIASGIGGLFSILVLSTIAPQLAKVALMFGPAEYFALTVFGLSIITNMSKDVIKGLLSGLLGILIATIGIDPIVGVNRFTFDSPNLSAGIAFIPALIGLFAVGEIFTQMSEGLKASEVSKAAITKVLPSFSQMKSMTGVVARGSVIGTAVGIIPGTGSNIASWISYNETRRSSKHPEKFGTGIMEGVAATESANNAVCGGALIPLLTLGIPGDSVTAVFLGGLMIHGLAPGPRLFVEHGALVSDLFAGAFVANILMVLIGFVAIRIAAPILKMPKKLLTVTILLLCCIGSYTINNNPFDILVMLTFGVIGFLFQRYHFSQPAMCIAMILGPMAEQNMRLALMDSNMSPLIFVTRPISLVFIIVSVLCVTFPLIRMFKRKPTSANAG